MDRDNHYRRFLECERDMRAAQRCAETTSRRSSASEPKMTRSSSPETVGSSSAGAASSSDAGEMEKVRRERDYFKRTVSLEKAVVVCL